MAKHCQPAEAGSLLGGGALGTGVAAWRFSGLALLLLAGGLLLGSISGSALASGTSLPTNAPPRVRPAYPPPAPPSAPMAYDNEFGQFAPVTENERELERMLRSPAERIDLGLACWLLAADLPQFQDLKREEYLAQLEALVEQVRRNIGARLDERALSGQPAKAHTRCFDFCESMIRQRFSYREE